MTAPRRSGHERASAAGPPRAVALGAVVLCLFTSGLAAAQKNKTEGPARAARPPAARPANRAPAAGPGGQPHSGPPAIPHPGERALERLENMTPQQRAKALQNLPPDRRREIEQKLEAYDRLSPSERARLRNQAERLASLPPQRQNQVRRSIQEFQNLPDDRKALVKRELDRMAGMPDEARRSYMNTEEFRNRYTPLEQQMMQNLSRIMPENRDVKD